MTYSCVAHADNQRSFNDGYHVQVGTLVRFPSQLSSLDGTNWSTSCVMVLVFCGSICDTDYKTDYKTELGTSRGPHIAKLWHISSDHRVIALRRDRHLDPIMQVVFPGKVRTQEHGYSVQGKSQ